MVPLNKDERYVRPRAFGENERSLVQVGADTVDHASQL